MFWLDGVAQTGEGARPDRGLEFGDGLFETIAIVGGRPRLLEAHLARLARGCARLGIAAPPAERVRAELMSAARTPGAGVLKLIVTRGAGGGGYSAAAGAVARRYLYALPPRERPPGFARGGVAVRICATRLAEQPLLAGIKHLNRLEQVCARAEWSDPAIAEGLLLDVHGRLVCGTMSNVFIVLGGELVTPLLTRAGVEGVMRAALSSEFRAAGARLTERDLDPEELGAASEVFLTNALIGAWPVRALGERRWAAGPWVRRAQAWVAGW
jgi:4-amino-4-deoxychorismate lyase